MDTQTKIRENLSRIKDYGWQVLDLKNCGLTEIPITIFSCSDLITIDLSNDLYCDEVEKTVKMTT